jgi:hypothetical protein
MIDIEAVSAMVHEQWIEAKRMQGIKSRLSETGEELMVPYAELSGRSQGSRPPTGAHGSRRHERGGSEEMMDLTK